MASSRVPGQGCPVYDVHNYDWNGCGPYGKGQVIMTTFKLSADAVTGDAIAKALLAGLITLADG